MSAADSPRSPGPAPTRWGRVVLIGCGSIVVLAIVVVGIGAYWFSSNKDRLVAMGKQASLEAAAFAASHSQDDCVDEGLKKIDACDGILCEGGAKAFTDMCIHEASPTPGLCDGVPAPTEILKAARWIQGQCGKHGRGQGDPKCSRLVQSVVTACQSR